MGERPGEVHRAMVSRPGHLGIAGDRAVRAGAMNENLAIVRHTRFLLANG